MSEFMAGPAYGVPVTSWSSDKSVFLTDIGPNRTTVVKIVKELTGMGLTDAFALIKSSPCLLLDNVHPAEAERVVRLLKEKGATAEVGVSSCSLQNSLVEYRNLVKSMNKLDEELRVSLSATIIHILDAGDIKKAYAFLDKIPNPSSLHLKLWNIIRTYGEESTMPEEP